MIGLPSSNPSTGILCLSSSSSRSSDGFKELRPVCCTPLESLSSLALVDSEL